MYGPLPPVNPTVMAVDLTDEPICGAPSPSEFRFCTDSETISGTPSTPSAGFLTDSEINPGTLPPPPSPSTPASLPDTEPWDNYPSPPALLDLLDTSDGSVSSGRRSESPPRLREDINSDPDGEHSYRDQPRAEMEPADSSTEVHNHEGAQRTLHCGDEAFVSHAVGDFFKHANVCMELDRVRLEVLRAQCATDLNLRVDLEARVVHWLYYNSDSEIQGRFNRYMEKIAQCVGNGMLPGVPSEVEWLMREELPPARVDVLQNVTLCGFFLYCAGGQQTGLKGLSDEDEKVFSAWCQEVDDNA